MDSYDEILARMKDNYAQLAGFEVPELSDIDIRLKVLASEVYNNQVNIEFIKRQMFPTTATGEYLDLHAEDRGLSRKESVKATGKIKFFVPAQLSTDLDIPKGTYVATSGSQSYRFITNEDAVITAGSLSVSVPATAEKGGTASNILANCADVLITAVPGISKVNNPKAFTGGTDVESDEELRSRILDTYISISNGTNTAYYKKLALSVAGVTGVCVVPRVRGTGTVDVYIANNNSKANASLIAEVQNLMDTQREVNVDVKVYTAEPLRVDLSIQLTVEDGYDFDTVAETVEQEITNYVSSLNVGEDVMDTHLGKVILSVPGVYTYYWDSTTDSNYSVSDSAFPVINQITITEVS